MKHMVSAVLRYVDRTIPTVLKAHSQWVLWKLEQDGTRWTKVPVCPMTLRKASSTDPDTWSDYTTVVMAAEKAEEHGIGFVFTREAGIVGIDLDKCRNVETGAIEPWAQEIVRSLNSYTEISPSGTGLHIYLRGTPPGRGRKKGKIEAYSTGRFFTLTGNHLPGTPLGVEERHTELLAFHAQHFGADSSTEQSAPENGARHSGMTDDEVLTKCRTARNAAKFEALWGGDSTGFPSHSEADLGLLGILRFYTQDPQQLDRLFRRSGLMRDKWDEPRGEQTYGERTIAEVLKHGSETYNSSSTTCEIHELEDDPEPQPADSLLGFPEEAWRGPFKRYREAMNGTSEAPDTSHFAAFWGVAAACLRRRVSFHYAYPHYPNVYLVNFGNTGDSKTSASRQGLRLLPDGGVKLLRGVGSAEALGDWMQQPDEGPTVSHLLFIEELATLLTRGGWEGSTLLSFLTETFDAPDRYEIPFRKNPVLVHEPTPTLIAGTTIEWLWKGLREIDVHGGFGNRIFYLTGTPKPPIPLPAKPNPEALAEVRMHLARLATQTPIELFFHPDAATIWDGFYRAWKTTTWPELTTAAIKRIPAYIVKLSMVYACLEETSLITAEQLGAAIKVGHYGAKCADLLMTRHRLHGVQGKCEARVLAVLANTDLPAWQIHRGISGSYTAEELQRAIRALSSTGTILEVKKTTRGEPVYGRRDRKRKV